jgi:hypothetical protein
VAGVVVKRLPRVQGKAPHRRLLYVWREADDPDGVTLRKMIRRTRGWR